MSQQQRARIEQQQHRERIKRRLRNGAAAVVLTGTVVGGWAATHRDDSSPRPAATAGAKGEAKPGPSQIPAELSDLIKQSASGQGGHPELTKVLNHPYREVLQKRVGNINLRVAEIGTVTGVDYEAVVNVYQNLATYISKAPQGATHNVAAYDSQNQVTQQLELSSQPTPVGKDITLLMVPSTVDIGSFQGRPDTFTDTKGAQVISFIRPDFSFDAGGLQGTMTEACQGVITVNLVDQDKVTADKVQSVAGLMQEQFCNSLGDALYGSTQGFSYEAYLQHINQNSGQGRTDHVVAPGSVGYASSVPFVGSQQVYEALATDIPENFGSSLVFPPITAIK